MIEFATPEFLLLAFPVWYALYRTAKLPGETGWLLAVPVWMLFFSWNLGEGAADWLRTVQAYSFVLLPIPLWFGLRNWGRRAGVTQWLRLALVSLMIVGLAGPRWNIGGKGVDIIVVVDRSRSLPIKGDADTREIITALMNHRAEGDRVAVVAYGRQSQIEQGLLEKQSFDGFAKQINPDGSDLDDALQKSLTLVDPNRPARILVISDGEANGPTPLTSARRAREAGVPIDFVAFDNQTVGDVAVKALSLPRTITPNEPFQFTATIQADGDAVAKIRLQRESVINGKTTRQKIAEMDRRLSSGRNDIRFGDVLAAGGTHRYLVEVDVKNDPRPQNNTWEDEIFVDAGPRMLLLVKDEAAKQGRLAKLLTAKTSGIPTDVEIAAQQPLHQLQLDRYRGVILEDVPAEQLGFLKMSRLAKFVTERGGGLMLTGGENSFGSGGYFKSPLDDILPVSMELREEHHKLKVAIAVVLDISGSMRVAVPGGRLKIDLAALGTEECVRLLSGKDMVSVITVNTSADPVQPLTSVSDKSAILSRVRRITSNGGGIWVDVALEAAKKELDKATGIQTRHVILFSDASDTMYSSSLAGRNEEEKHDTIVKQVADLKAAGISVSVIGLGTEQNPHAPLLKRIAKAGGGNVMFTDDARDLPRLFSQDTMTIARNTFLRKDEEHPNGFAGKRLPGPYLVGDLGGGRFPNVDGYNLTYLRKQARTAQAAVISDDEYKAPWAAFWYRGLGRSVALPIAVSGKYAGEFGRWKNGPEFLLTQSRWLLGGSDPRDIFVEIERQGQDAVVTVEFDPRSPDHLKTPPKLLVIPPGAEPEDARRPEFVWTDRNILQARFALDRRGIFRTQVATGENRSIRGPSISLPYSPEFFPRTGLPTGRQTLLEISRLSDGQERTDVLELLDRTKLPRLPRMVSLLPWIAIAATLLLLTEIAGRRLALWERGKFPQVADDLTGLPVPEKRKWWPDWSPASLFRRKNSQPPTVSDEKPATPVSTPAAGPTMSSLLEQAKQRARQRQDNS